MDEDDTEAQKTALVLGRILMKALNEARDYQALWKADARVAYCIVRLLQRTSAARC